MSKRVVICYDMLDVAFYGDVTDFTDGKYDGDEKRSYLDAQDRQANWLLDQIHATEGKNILDIGCGYGRILKTAIARGVRAKGITLSPQQQSRCKANGLNVDILSYTELSPAYDGKFDGIIANGSLEHFIQVQDTLDGKQDEIYREMFRICHRLLKPGGYFATTAIHFPKPIDPKMIARGSRVFPKMSDNAHFARILLENLGGWYPVGNQLEACARGLFRHELREEATHDYHLTSEYWLQAIKNGLKRPAVWLAIAGKFLKNPRATYGMLDTWLFSQSWMWQFRPRPDGTTPTILYRDVWKKVDELFV